MTTHERFKTRVNANKPTQQQLEVLQGIANELNTLLMFLDAHNFSLLQRRAKEADTTPAVWLIDALNLQADVDAGRSMVMVIKSQTFLEDL